MNYKMIIQYDGSRYSGWQRQGNTTNTIQARIESVISEHLKEDVQIIGSGRTDAGVHAEGQVANFHCHKNLSTADFLETVNKDLPTDIAIISINPVGERFHARLNAVSKTYRYTINRSNISDVFKRRFEYQLSLPLNIKKMRDGAQLFLGTHDFKSFSSVKTKKSTLRTINSINIIEDENKVILEFDGNGFLYNMVRIITGTLIEIGIGTRSIETIPALLQSTQREHAGFTAPPQGLCLVSVQYPIHI